MLPVRHATDTTCPWIDAKLLHLLYPSKLAQGPQFCLLYYSAMIWNLPKGISSLVPTMLLVIKWNKPSHMISSVQLGLGLCLAQAESQLWQTWKQSPRWLVLARGRHAAMFPQTALSRCLTYLVWLWVRSRGWSSRQCLHDTISEFVSSTCIDWREPVTTIKARTIAHCKMSRIGSKMSCAIIATWRWGDKDDFHFSWFLLAGFKLFLWPAFRRRFWRLSQEELRQIISWIGKHLGKVGHLSSWSRSTSRQVTGHIPY